MVDHEALERVATRLGYKDMDKVRYVCHFLKNGASLGIEGVRITAHATNLVAVKLV